VCDALMAQLSILIFQYLCLVSLSVHHVLVVRLRCFQLVNPCLKICRQLDAISDYSKVLQEVLNGFGGRHTFVLLVQHLVLPDQVVPLRLHLLYFVMVLGKGAMEFGLEQRKVLL
jgi:hypothetical protein